MKGVHVKWSVLRWAEGQSFILCDPRCKLLYSQGKERVNRSIVHCWITCKCCNYMYICRIFFCTLSSFLFLLLFCVVILFIFGSVLCSKCFCLPWFTIMIHSTAFVQSAFVSFIWFCLYLLHSEKGAITLLFFNSTNIEFDIGHYCDLQNEWLRTPSPLFYLLNVCQFYNEFGNEHLMTSV